MKTSHVAVVALGAAVMAALLAYPVFAATASANASPTTISSGAAASGSPATAPSPNVMHRGPGFFWANGGPFGDGRGGRSQPTTTFSNGQTITLTSTSGTYYVVGTQGKTNGTASGTLTFTVAGNLRAGYIVNIAGSIVVNGTAYNITSGSGTMGPGGASIMGQGATSSSGSYILRAYARGDFSGTTSARVSVDFSNGTTEYAVFLTSSIQG